MIKLPELYLTAEAPFTMVLRLPKGLKLTNKQFDKLCELNDPLYFERTSEGDLVIMTPTGGGTGNRNFELTIDFGVWARADGTGIGFDSSTLFVLPNGAIRGPDVSWIRRSRWEALTSEQQEAKSPICPDFVIELRSRSDRLPYVQAKMQEYIDNGAELGWLIDPYEKTVYIYRPGQPVERLDNPETVSGDPVLPGFVLEVRTLWS